MENKTKIDKTISVSDRHDIHNIKDTPFAILEDKKEQKFRIVSGKHMASKREYHTIDSILKRMEKTDIELISSMIISYMSSITFNNEEITNE
jgi:hypothetical protein